MRHVIFKCPTTGHEFLIDTTTGEYEQLSESEVEEELVVDADEADALDEPEQESEEEPVNLSTDLNYRNNTSTEHSYKAGTPMVPGNISDDGKYIENKPVTHYGSGIRVETNMAQTPPPGVRQQGRKFNPQPPGVATPFAPKRKKPSEITDADSSREGLEVTGADATQDFTGATGWEAHMDNLQQQQFESDPYGFQSANY